ncbi:MAG: VOC family protein [Actinomycetota bacterium]
MSVPARINIVTLGVADLARSTAFYAALGWRRCSSSVEGTIVWFDTRGSYLGLFGSDALAADAGLAGAARGGFGGVTLAINVRSAEEATEALATAERAGGSIIRPGHHAPEFDGFSGYFADPDGHAWEVAYNPGFPLDEQGQLTIP